MILKIQAVMAILSAHNGFVRADTFAREYHKLGSADVPAALLYETIDALEAVSEAMKHTQPDTGFAMVANRGKSRFGLDDSTFPKTLMPDDPRPKLRRGRTKTVKLDDAGNPIPEKEQNNWIPGIATVDSKFWEQEQDAAALVAKYQDTLDTLGLICTVKSVRTGVVEGVNGAFVNIWVPTVE